MIINNLSVNNFKRFYKKCKFDFDPHFNLIVGENGSGKSSLLEALSIGSSSFFLGSMYINSIGISTDDVTFSGLDNSDYPCVIECTGMIGEKKLKWKRTRKCKKSRTDWKDCRELIVDAKNLFQGRTVYEKRIGSIPHCDFPLPLIVHYGPNRLWNKSRLPLPEVARLAGYHRWKCASIDTGLIDEIFFDIADNLETEEAIPFAKYCVLNLIETFSKITTLNYRPATYMGNNDLRYLIDNTYLHLSQLSDGYRNILSLIADIAARSFLLNPKFREKASEKTTGIVLIDEVDMHLHPRWQRSIIEDISNAFPSMQFFATTHSPFTVQSLRRGKIINIEGRSQHPWFDKSIEDIAEDLMGVEIPQKSRRYIDMINTAEEFYQILEQGKKADNTQLPKIESRLDTLLERYSDDPAYVAFLRMEKIAAQIGE